MAAFGATEAGAVAMCDKCSHHHNPEDKCKMCGHVGRLIIFPGPDDPHPPPHTFHTVRFDVRTPPEEVSFGNWRLGVLMRTKVFIEELDLVKGHTVTAASGRRTEKTDVDAYDVAVSRHILGRLGDAPVAYARWRFITAASVDGGAPTDGGMIVVIDRLLTAKEYRNRGYGRAILAYCLTDVLQMMIEIRVAVNRISLFIPVKDECLAAAKTAIRCGLQVHGTAMASDPTETVAPEAVTAGGVQEFAISADALAGAYASALSGAGVVEGAVGDAGGGAVHPGGASVGYDDGMAS